MLSWEDEKMLAPTELFFRFLFGQYYTETPMESTASALLTFMQGESVPCPIATC